ncbi:MAG: glutathione S-transferase family protein [Byssovorax sp.]
MGRLVDGKWTTQWYTPDAEGRFVRGETAFRRRITADGSSGFPASRGRYHLYVSYACPWAHRTLIARALLGLEDAVSISVVNPFMGDDGWTFAEGPGVVADPIHQASFLWQVYAAASPDYTGRVTVPILLDKPSGAIVNNESRDIVRMLDALRQDRASLAPEPLRAEIDRTLDAIYTPINNGVYRAGFAVSQAAYEEGVTELFAALGHWEEVLSTRRYLCGATLTEADICLFTTLYRFDPVYHGHFKCNIQRIQDYPNLWGFTRDIYQTPGVAATCHLDHIKEHYYRSHPGINPTRIVPVGPRIDHAAPHGRDVRFG